MKTCTNPEIGQMIGLYEFDCLSSAEKQKFEDHLLVCDACFQDFYEFSPAVKVMQENIDEFRKAVEIKNPIHERMREKVFSFLEDVWQFSGKIICGKPKIAIPALAGVGIIVLMTLIFKPGFLYPPIVKNDLNESKPKKIIVYEPEVMEPKGTLEKRDTLTSEREEFGGIEVELSEDKDNILIKWDEVAGAEFYHIYLIENGEKQRMTPPQGVQQTSWSFPARHIKFNTEYIFEVSSELKDGERFQAMMEFVKNK